MFAFQKEQGSFRHQLLNPFVCWFLVVSGRTLVNIHAGYGATGRKFQGHIFPEDYVKKHSTDTIRTLGKAQQKGNEKCGMHTNMYTASTRCTEYWPIENLVPRGPKMKAAKRPMYCCLDLHRCFRVGSF